uniref:Uncharacterized protein n=1 Tax=Arundo donax TaxID=35708 RepID=A0A0A9G4U6_ARUDO
MATPTAPSPTRSRRRQLPQCFNLGRLRDILAPQCHFSRSVLVKPVDLHSGVIQQGQFLGCPTAQK